MGLQRGDVVVYKFHKHIYYGLDAKLDGTLAVVLDPYIRGRGMYNEEYSSVFVQLISTPSSMPLHWINTEWYKRPFFDERNCVLVGHIDLDLAEAGREGEKRWL
jgi:hypothetical protein